MMDETEQIKQGNQSISKRERLYFWLLLLSTLMTGCGLVVGILTLGTSGVVLVGILSLLLGIIWMRQWVRVMAIRADGVFLSEKQQPAAYEQLRQDAKQLGFWKVPEVILTRHRTITRPRTMGLFQKYMLVLPADYKLDETTHFEVLRELVHLKQNHEEKRMLLLLGSWVPFLRSAYLRACEETADRLALAQLEEENRIPTLVRSVVGPAIWNRLDLTDYIEEKQQAPSLAMTLSELFRHQRSVSWRLMTAGLKTPSRAPRLATGLFVSLSYVVLASLVFFATTFATPGWLTNWTKPVEQAVGSKQDLGETKLMAAIQKGTLDEINKLIPTSDMKAVDADGDTALHYLGYRKSSEGLEGVFDALLAAGSNVDSVNEFGERPFITAVYSNNKELVALYLKRGEAINQQDAEKYTPLHHAVEGEGTQTVKLLLDQGADPALKNADGYTPLMMAQEYELDDVIVLLKQKQTQTL
ncbi:ankyrin repeat domain-containing protein [Exiguobacterium sp. KRL4]|uniref:ankyrin repeat domain-containing protein n=1 Tax=Exiguobacterium sp. KRL4 TaxID=1914536 RepID=UPI001F19EB13|nr:ankyrin repeat domain-containing protein [Exiguobacterium sp. KRL4]